MNTILLNQLLDKQTLLCGRESDECGCPEEEWDMLGVHTIIHLEPDGTGHIFLDGGDWDDEKLIDCQNIPQLRLKALSWVNSLPKEEY